MNPEDIMLNENEPDIKRQCCVIPLVKNAHDRQTHRWKVGAMAWGTTEYKTFLE